jgi:hypothetical protein
LIVIFDPPEFDKTTDCVRLLPTGTFPKLTLDGFTVSCPGLADANEVSARIVQKMKNGRNPRESSQHLETSFFTMQPLMSR